LSTGNRSGFSKKQWREVRKELLVARSTLARLEVMQAREAFSDSMSRFGWLGMIVPGFRKRAHAGASESLLASLATSLPGFLQPVLRSAWPFLQRHPVSAALLAIITGRSDTSRGALGVAGPAKWMGIAVVGIKALGAWRKLNRYRHARRTRKAERT
jgi:hypothetical protein